MNELIDFLDRFKLYLLTRKPFLYHILNAVRIEAGPCERVLEVGHFKIKIDPQKFFGMSDDTLRVRTIELALYSILQRVARRAGYYDGSYEAFREAVAIAYARDWGSRRLREDVGGVFRSRMGAEAFSKASIERIAELLEKEDLTGMMGYAKMLLSAASSMTWRDDSRSSSEDETGEESGTQVLQEGDVSIREKLRISHEEFERGLQELVARAAMYGRMAGTSDPIAERMLEQLRRRRPWPEILRLAMIEALGARIRQSYRTLNRKVEDLPGKVLVTRKVVVAVDVSGSIADSEYEQFVSTVDTIIPYAEVAFVAWDTRAVVVGRPRTSSDLRKMARKARGYGGTQPDCLVPLLRKLKPHVLVILTDGYWGKWGELAKWARGRRVIVATNGMVGPWERVFWKVIRVVNEA